MTQGNSRYALFKQNIEQVVDTILGSYEPEKLGDDKVIRDAVFGFNLFYKHEVNLLDAPLLQRLRRIHQTSLAFLVYPSATHTRFEHSLGCTVIAEKMMRAVNGRHLGGAPIDPVQRAEVRLAGLLHDCGHGPFSHASEFVYGKPPYEVPDIQREEKDLFGGANPHEIMSFCIVTSNRFRKLWEKVVSLYDFGRDSLVCDLKKIDLGRVAAMILGKKWNEGSPLYLSQIINGPFDADKFDYIIRDGHFSGLVTAVDVERLFITLDIAAASEHGHSEFPETSLCIDVGGATVLEQVLFNKMILFSSLYNHHKVRASFRLLVQALRFLRGDGLSLKGILLDTAPSFCLVDDDDLLALAERVTTAAVVSKAFTALRNRHLPKRACVIPKDALLDKTSQAEYFRLRDDSNLVSKMEIEIAQLAGCNGQVFIDFPPEPSFAMSGLHSLVKLGPGRYVTLDKLYPASGWVTGYAEYRYRAYVFAPAAFQRQVNEAAMEVFETHGVKLNHQLCSELAKLGSS